MDAAGADAAFEAIAGELASSGVRTSKMFGMPCLKGPDGKAFVGLHEGELVVKLLRDTPEHAAALAIEGAHLFDPMGGRPMKDWICLPAGSRAEWSEFAAQAWGMRG
jgi:hypothetical protein